MKPVWSKFWSWMKCEDELGVSNGKNAPLNTASKHSDIIASFQTYSKVSDTDILQLSHDLGNGRY